jgi:hypothetical protein
MALTQEQKQKAKNEAKEYLEYSIYTLSLILGVDPEVLDENFINPESQEVDVARWKSFESLIKQIQAYSALAD